MRFHRYIFRGPIKQMVETLGLRNDIAKIYARLLWGTGKEKYTAQIGNTRVKFRTSNFSEFHRVLYNSGEEDIISDILNSHSKNEDMLDIGANIGIFTCFIGEKLKDGSIIACEPHPANYNQLQNNIQLNDTNAIAKQIALFDEEGKLDFDLKSTKTGEGHGQIKKSGNNKKTVETIYGDTLFTNKNHSIPATIKIDVEGAEVNVLSGLTKTINNSDCKRVYCEVHVNHIPSYGYSEHKIFEIMDKCGFTEEKRFSHGGNSYLVKFIK